MHQPDVSQDEAFKRMLAQFRLPQPRDPQDELAFFGAGGRMRDYGMLRPVTLPERWYVQQADRYNGMLFDRHGRLRGDFYYHFGRREARLVMRSRYCTSSADDLVNQGAWYAADNATGEVIFVPESTDSDESNRLVIAWLNEHYPKWEQPFRYWNDIPPRRQFWKWMRRLQLTNMAGRQIKACQPPLLGLSACHIRALVYFDRAGRPEFMQFADTA